MRPLFARVLLAREKLMKSGGGIIIPEHAQKSHAALEGRVVAVGPTCHSSVKDLIGRRVAFGTYAGEWQSKHRLPDLSPTEDLFICQDEDLLYVVDDDPSGTVIPMKAAANG